MSSPLPSTLKLCVMTTGSMRPTLDVGDFVMVDETFSGAWRPGDLALLSSPNSGEPPFVHRVLGVRAGPDGPRLSTKGDARLDLDAPSPISSVLGRAVRMGRKGGGWVELDGIGASWTAAGAAPLFAWAAAQKPSAVQHAVEQLILDLVAMEWAEHLLWRLYRRTLQTRMKGVADLRRLLLSLSIDAEVRRRRGVFWVREVLNAGACGFAAWGLRSAKAGGA